jgi:DNA-binding transcriptional ArsR family regulator
MPTAANPTRPSADHTMDALTAAAECLRTLAHPCRLRIVQLLLAGEHTVGELAAECGTASHVTSEHLRLMQRCGFLTSRRSGRNVYYHVAEPHLKDIMRCVERRFLTAATP